jgi:hypothetical protein
MKERTRLVLVTIISTLLAGCATSVTIKDLEKDKLGLLKANFGVNEVPTGIASAIAREVPAAENFSQLVLKLRQDYDGKASTSGFDYTATIINVGKGLRQELWESSNNGIAHVTEMRLSHLGMIPIKSQYGYHGANRTTESNTVKSVTILKAGIAQPVEGGTYEYEYKLGGPIQIANLYTSAHKCFAGKVYEASTIHTGLAGKVIDLECEMSNEGKVRGKSTYSFLQTYGVALRKSFANSEGKSVYRVIGVTVS